MRRKRLLIDVDDVLAEFTNAALDALHRLTNRRRTRADFDVWDWMFTCLTEEERAPLIEELNQQGFCKTLQPIPGAIEGVKHLRTIVDIFPVTAHFPTPTWVHDRDEWLYRVFGFDRKQIVYTGSKFLVKGDAFLDDNPDHVVAWKREYPEGMPMLWHVPNTESAGLHEFRVRSWPEVIDRVERLVASP
jgi:5'(3')-deoxyribonucleotidase